jgi:2-desacetyl-2-hydroxyethyl bacteriochlorophyllide A dehydrogenase
MRVKMANAKKAMNPSLIIHELGKVKLGERELRTPQPGEVMIRTEFSGVSVGTEMAGAHGRNLLWGNPPFTPGYQGVGRIVEFGDPSKKGNFEEGQLVAYFTGAGTHQAFTTASLERTHPVNESELYKYVGLFVQPSVGANALNKAKIKSGDSVLVIGQGLIGQATALLAMMRGAHVIATDVSKERLAVAEKYCAHRVINTSKSSAWEQLEKDFPKGFDVVIESTGVLPLVEDALRCTKFEGTMVFEGHYAGDLKFEFNLAHRKQLNAVFPFFIGEPSSRESVINQITSGHLNLQPLVSHEINWRESEAVYSKLFTPEKDSMNGILIDWRDAF